MENTRTLTTTRQQFGSTKHAGTVPGRPAVRPGSDQPPARRGLSWLSPSPGPVYLEGRLVLSLSFQGGSPNLDAIVDDEVVLENYRLWDDAANAWHEDDLVVFRFENADVVMRLEPQPTAVWSGSLDTQARVILVPDLDRAGFAKNQEVDLRWRKVS